MVCRVDDGFFGQALRGRSQDPAKENSEQGTRNCEWWRKERTAGRRPRRSPPAASFNRKPQACAAVRPRSPLARG